MCEILSHDVKIGRMIVARNGFHGVKSERLRRRTFRDGLRNLAVTARFREDIGFLLRRIDQACNRVDGNFRIGTATAIRGDDIPAVGFLEIAEGETIGEDERRLGLAEIRIVFLQCVKFSEISIAVLLDAFAIGRGELHHLVGDGRDHAFCKRGRKPNVLVKSMMMVMMMFMLVLVIVMIVVVVLRFLMFMIVIVIMFFIMIRFFMLMLMLMFRFFMFVLVVVVIGIFVFMIVIVVFVFVMVMFFRREKGVFHDFGHHEGVHTVELRELFIRTADCDEKGRRARLHDIVGTRFIRVQIAVIDEIVRLDGRAFRERTRPVIEGVDRRDDFRTGRFFFRLFVFFGGIPRTSCKTHKGRKHNYAFFPIFHIKKTSFFFWVHK